MTSTWLMKALGGFFVLIAVVSVFERNGPRALFYFCSAGLQVALVWGMR